MSWGCAPQHEVSEGVGGWFWRCCYGCHGCSARQFGPFPSEGEAREARAEFRFLPLDNGNYLE